MLLSLPCNVKTITNSGEPERQIRHHMSNRPTSRLKQSMLIGLLLALSYPWKEVSEWCQWWTIHGNQLSLCLFTPQSCSFLGFFLIDCFFFGCLGLLWTSLVCQNHFSAFSLAGTYWGKCECRYLRKARRLSTGWKMTPSQDSSVYSIQDLLSTLSVLRSRNFWKHIWEPGQRTVF